MSASRFNDIIKEVNAETGAKGKELFHPIRIVVAGSHSGPAFDKLVPVFERGSRLKLPAHVASVRERVEAFMRARAK
jgi:glutamyl-tRNA synthetase/nondiscriminating glutamyl-tRNA synthetase